MKLISPDDRSGLRPDGDCLVDSSGHRYPLTNGVPDLRPQAPVEGALHYALKDHQVFRRYRYAKTLQPLFPEQLTQAQGLKERSFAGFVPPAHPGALALDHGCGSGSFRGTLESLGYTYIGVDNESGTSTEQGGGEAFKGGADYLCDLHRLPFPGNSFQFAVSFSVFEHLQNPFVAAEELFRVMEAGGVCYVSVATIVPFHMDSFFHYTHFGVLALFSSAGFEVQQVAGARWNAYAAISSMDGLPGPRWLRVGLTSLIYGAHRLLWLIRAVRQRKDLAAEDLRRHLMLAGVTKAVLVKPGKAVTEAASHRNVPGGVARTAPIEPGKAA